MDPRLLLQLSAKNNQRKTYIWTIIPDHLFNPSLGNIYTICHFWAFMYY